MSLHVEQIRVDWMDDAVGRPANPQQPKPAQSAAESGNQHSYWEHLESSDDEVSRAVREWLDLVVDRDD